MEAAINWHDEYTNTKDRVVYTEDQHGIPGVRTLAHHVMTHAIPSLNWHYHENTFEFSMSTKGSISFSTRTSTYQFSGGNVFVAFPNEVHGTNYSPITVGELYWFQLDISDPEHFLFLNREAASAMINRLKAIPNHIVHTDGQKTIPLLKTAFRLGHTEKNAQLTATYLQLFLHLLIESADKEQLRLSPDISRTLDYILENICERLSLETLASLANLSCSQYKQKFKKQLGVSPRHFINQQKVEYSKSLLLQGMSVTEIAMLLGFNTSSYFSTVFRKYTMLTPTEYVKMDTKERQRPEKPENLS